MENLILNSLPESDYTRLSPHLTPVTQRLGDIVYQADADIEYLYFPETVVFSMLSTMIDGSTTEVGLIGREGMLGVRVVLGTLRTPHSAIVQMSGTAQRLSAQVFSENLAVSPALQTLALRYTQALIAQSRQGMACATQHSVAQRVARWLLMMADYTKSDELELTHEIISVLIGARRAGISVIAQVFREEGLIESKRGHVKILNRARLEAESCECYQVMKGEIEQLYIETFKNART
jgi:CRP-like cAMP-binding protein